LIAPTPRWRFLRYESANETDGGRSAQRKSRKKRLAGRRGVARTDGLNLNKYLYPKIRQRHL
jgi:hypothetical protein